MSPVALADPPRPEAPANPGVEGEPPPTITQWVHAFPAASAALADWAQKNPDAARQAVWWDHRHPLRAQYFLRWLLEHQDQTVEDFASAHEAWPAAKLVLRPNREALGGLAAWARAHPEALQQLLSEPRGFSWIGFHDLEALWQPANPGEPSGR